MLFTFMKKNLLTIILAVLSTLSFAQESSTQNWKAVVSNDNVAVYTSVGSCTNSPNGIDKNELIVKVVNKTNQSVTVTLEYSMTYGEKCYNCEGGNSEFQHTITIPANGSVEGECYQEGRKALSFLHSFINIDNQTRLTDYQITILSTENNSTN